MKKIKIGIIGVGNCASSLVQGIEYYKNNRSDKPVGVMHKELGGYSVSDIEVGFAVDIDERKVGKDLSEAVYALPNCTAKIVQELKSTGVRVTMGAVLDGVSGHTQQYDEKLRVVISREKETSMNELVHAIKKSGVEMLVNYLPVGSREAAYFYAECAIRAQVGFINCMPVFIASDDKWIQRFREGNVPCIGDDIKSQLGATIIHRELIRLFEERGIRLTHTYQLNTGGNTDFLNMLNRNRLFDKRISKTMAVQTNLTNQLDNRDIHVGPSDYVQWQKDNKVCFLRIEGRQFGDIPMELELRLSVEDSPNSAGVVIDAIRCMRIALDRGMSGDIVEPSTYFMKQPRIQQEDFYGRKLLEQFIKEEAVCLQKLSAAEGDYNGKTSI